MNKLESLQTSNVYARNLKLAVYKLTAFDRYNCFILYDNKHGVSILFKPPSECQ